MRPVLRWVAVAALWCMVGTAEGAPARLEEARAALAEGLAFREARQYAEAAPKAERALALHEAVLGGGHPDVARCLDLLGDLRWRQGSHAQAERLLRRALALREAALGKRHPDVATSLHLLGNVQADLGFYGRAAPLLERALAIREEAPGERPLDVASSLHDLARVYQLQGLYARAEPLYARALALREAALGGQHPDVATSLESLAAIHQLQGGFTRAESLYTRALALREASLGRDPLRVAYALTSLAFLCQERGQYARAESLYLRALSTFEAALGPDHPKVSDALLNLALLHDTQGLYGRSLPFYARALVILEQTFRRGTAAAADLINLDGRLDPLQERALAISEANALGKTEPRIETSLDDLAFLYNLDAFRQWSRIIEQGLAIYEAGLGKSHPDVADLLMRYASLYQDLGQYGRMEPLVQRALAIYESTCGRNHPRVAAALRKLALVHRKRGLHARAEPLLRRALGIWETSLGERHPDVAPTLHELASSYQQQGLYARAEPLLRRALAIQEAAFGETHPDVALTLTRLASLYQDQGAHARAEPLLRRALAIREASLGKAHPDVGLVLGRLAGVHLAEHRLADALPLLMRAFGISEAHLRQEALGFSESHLANFLQFIRVEEERLYSLLRAYPEDARVRRLALAAALLRKGRSVEELSGTSRAVYRSLGAEDRDLFQRLQELRFQIARVSLDGPGPLSPADHQQRLQALHAQADTLEENLAARSAPLRAMTALPSPETIVERVAGALPMGGALIEFVSYVDRPLTVVPSSALAAAAPGAPRYLAVVLFPDGSSRAVDLGPAAPIDLAAARLGRALASRDSAWEGPSKALAALVFQPLVPLLGDTRRLFLSPDGQLGLVPFAALHDGRGLLVDTFDFTYLTSGKDLLPRDPGPSGRRSVVVIADPDFGASAARSSSRASTPVRTRRFRLGERPSEVLRAELAGQDWAPLPGTRQEAETVQRSFPQAQLFLGADATRERLFQLAAPGVLHIATHGFFLDDSTRATGARGLGEFGGFGNEDPTRFPPDPLLRSGLVLAGDTEAARPSGASRFRSNEMVTALELAGLDLWGTELVVLSACDTGRGAVSPGQGVFGLRRAFVIAGAETVVMSLWKINDDTTRLLIDGYYRGLVAGQGRSAALRETMLALRESRPHPYYWAPLITLGRDAPLRTVAPTPGERRQSPPTDGAP